MSKQNDFIECELWLIHETAEAFLLSSDEDEDDKEWFPKTQCQWDPEDLPADGKGIFTLSIKERYLLKKGFL